MVERVELRVDGRPAAVEAGITVAAALANTGVSACRESVSGESRGVLCAMGTCFECRVTIDGVAHRRACVELVRDGMDVVTRSSEFRVSSCEFRVEAIECDVAVVGAGPAGIAAACRAAESGVRTVLLDEGWTPGGQIHRRLPGSDAPEAARGWLERLASSGASVRSSSSVYDAWREGDLFRLRAESQTGEALDLRAKRVVVATGARELFLPFPGWTLPGVMGAGAAQALWKSGASMAGKTAVVAGSGPLLLAVAASLTKAGARVALVAEQTGAAALARFTAELLRFPGKLAEAVRYRSAFLGVPYRTGTWVAEAKGAGRLEGVGLTDGRARFDLPCDLAAVAYGLVPNGELARLLGCATRRGCVEVDALQQTRVPGVFCAGEPCGVAGVEVAVAEGEIAGLAAAGAVAKPREVRRLSAERERGRRLAAAMHRAFRPRPELRDLPRPEDIVCRCEDTRLSALSSCGSLREAKLSSRAGMGPCQGRICGPALSFLFGWDSDTVRPPVKPAALGSLVPPE